jgi:aminoglycoside phosphotransferase (APT) family kinase protein
MPEPLPARVDAAVRAVASQLGLAADHARPLRMHDAATLLLPADHVVLRLVPDTGDTRARASRAVQLTAWLATQHFPAIRPAADTPIEVDRYVATLWHEVPATPCGTPVEVNTALGRLLHVLHALPATPVALPTADPLARLRAALRLDAARPEPVLTSEETAFLHGRVDELADRYAAMSFPLGSGLIHNDAHPGNMIADPSTRHGYVLTDWEGACIGPRELDVVLVGAPGSRFGDPEHERLAFTAGYGYDIADWPLYQELRDIRDLHSLAAYIRASTSKPATLIELHRRISSLQDDDRTIQWAAV